MVSWFTGLSRDRSLNLRGVQQPTDFKIFLQRCYVALPRDREMVSQIYSIKLCVFPSGKVAFDAERTTRAGHADRLWAIALACQKERGPVWSCGAEIGVRVIG